MSSDNAMGSPFPNVCVIIVTRRYSGLTSNSCGGLRPPAEAFFCPLSKKRAFYAVLDYFRPFWRSVVTLVTLSSTLSNFEKNPKKKSKKVKKNTQKNQK